MEKNKKKLIFKQILTGVDPTDILSENNLNSIELAKIKREFEEYKEEGTLHQFLNKDETLVASLGLEESVKEFNEYIGTEKGVLLLFKEINKASLSILLYIRKKLMEPDLNEHNVQQYVNCITTIKNSFEQKSKKHKDSGDSFIDNFDNIRKFDFCSDVPSLMDVDNKQTNI